MCVVRTVAMVMLLKDFGRSGIIFTNVRTTSDFPVVLNGQFAVNCIVWKVEIVEFSLCQFLPFSCYFLSFLPRQFAFPYK